MSLIMKYTALYAAVAGVVATLASPMTAQGRHLFTLDTTMSSFSASGTIVVPGIGPVAVIAQPPTFSLSGSLSTNLTLAAGAIASGQIVPGSTTVVVPTLNATVPNPIPFLPPLGTVTITGVQANFASVDPLTGAPKSFAVAPGGTFTTSAVATLLSGTATIVVTGLPTLTIPLAGEQNSPEPISGAITAKYIGFCFNVPLSTTVPFSDPTTGISGTLTVSGTIAADDEDLATDVGSISVGSGGVQTFTLSAGTAHGGRPYLLLGSVTGTTPGFSVGGVNIPLNFDSWMLVTATQPNTGLLGNTFASLDSLGVGTATFTMPALPALAPLVGIPFNHAYVVFSGSSIVLASNAVPLSFTL